jgi:ubiquinone/menaquinone biosynthesis C-methylase UbiE
MHAQIDRGVEYYFARLQRLGLGGQRVLDAGCGMGNWSVALSQLYERVDALEINALRLRAVESIADSCDGRIITRLGSIEDLPYPDQCFDTVYCNGVLFLTRYRRSLQEFARVLKPGGTLAITFNGRAWWYHLIQDRGLKEPICIFYGCNALIALFHRYLDDIDFAHSVSPSGRLELRKILNSAMPGTTDVGQQINRYRDAADNELRRHLDDSLADWFATECARIDNRSGGRTRLLPSLVRTLVVDGGRVRFQGQPVDYVGRALADVMARALVGRADYALPLQTHSHEPEEMSAELAKFGFHEILSAPEGCLALDPASAPIQPIYARQLGVYEIVARRFDDVGHAA